MAKYERLLIGDFQSFLIMLERELLSTSDFTDYEDGTDAMMGDVRIVTRAYGLYGVRGDSRVSLSVTLVGRGRDLYLSMVTSGGTRGMYEKSGALGQNNFMKRAIKAVERCIQEP